MWCLKTGKGSFKIRIEKKISKKRDINANVSKEIVIFVNN